MNGKNMGDTNKAAIVSKTLKTNDSYENGATYDK